MLINHECPICKRKEAVSWVLVKRDGGLVKICATCAKEAKEKEETLSTAFYESAKKKAEAERKVKNDAVLRSYRIAPKRK